MKAVLDKLNLLANQAALKGYTYSQAHFAALHRFILAHQTDQAMPLIAPYVSGMVNALEQKLKLKALSDKNLAIEIENAKNALNVLLVLKEKLLEKAGKKSKRKLFVEAEELLNKTLLMPNQTALLKEIRKTREILENNYQVKGLPIFIPKEPKALQATDSKFNESKRMALGLVNGLMKIFQVFTDPKGDPQASLQALAGKFFKFAFNRLGSALKPLLGEQAPLADNLGKKAEGAFHGFVGQVKRRQEAEYEKIREAALQRRASYTPSTSSTSTDEDSEEKVAPKAAQPRRQRAQSFSL